MSPPPVSATLRPTFEPAVMPMARQRSRAGLQTVVLLIGVHLALGVLLEGSKALATMHALGVLALGLRYAVRNSTHSQAIYVCSYLATGDVLWRMSKARVPWEYGKYALILLLVVIMFQRGVRAGLGRWAMLYFGLLIPSAALTVGYFGLTQELRQALSFNLSGPLTIAVAVIFFSGLRGLLPDLSQVLMWMLMPVVSVFSIAAYSTLTAGRIDFALQANFTTSGGFGPNQVSAILGLGVLAALLLALNTNDPPMRLCFLGIATALQLQSLLTFSRGGTFNLIVAVVFLGVHFIQHRRARSIFVLLLGAVMVLGVFFVLPKLNDWTSGMMSQRFGSVDTTGRQTLAEADLRLFKQHPLVGVGPGLSAFRRAEEFHRAIAAHTEYTRLLAEHGTLGAVSIVVLLLIIFQAYRLAPTALAKGWVTCLAGWSMAEMAHSAMRIVAIGFLLGLATLPFHRHSRNKS